MADVFGVEASVWVCAKSSLCLLGVIFVVNLRAAFILASLYFDKTKNCKQNKTRVEQTIDAGIRWLGWISVVEVWNCLTATRPVP